MRSRLRSAQTMVSPRTFAAQHQARAGHRPETARAMDCSVRRAVDDQDDRGRDQEAEGARPRQRSDGHAVVVAARLQLGQRHPPHRRRRCGGGPRDGGEERKQPRMLTCNSPHTTAQPPGEGSRARNMSELSRGRNIISRGISPIQMNIGSAVRSQLLSAGPGLGPEHRPGRRRRWHRDLFIFSAIATGGPPGPSARTPPSKGPSAEATGTKTPTRSEGEREPDSISMPPRRRCRATPRPKGRPAFSPRAAPSPASSASATARMHSPQASSPLAAATGECGRSPKETELNCQLSSACSPLFPGRRRCSQRQRRQQDQRRQPSAEGRRHRSGQHGHPDMPGGIAGSRAGRGRAAPTSRKPPISARDGHLQPREIRRRWRAAAGREWRPGDLREDQHRDGDERRRRSDQRRGIDKIEHASQWAALRTGLTGWGKRAGAKARPRLALLHGGLEGPDDRPRRHRRPRSSPLGRHRLAGGRKALRPAPSDGLTTVILPLFSKLGDLHVGFSEVLISQPLASAVAAASISAACWSSGSASEGFGVPRDHVPWAARRSRRHRRWCNSHALRRHGPVEGRGHHPPTPRPVAKADRNVAALRPGSGTMPGMSPRPARFRRCCRPRKVHGPEGGGGPVTFLGREQRPGPGQRPRA